MKPYKKPQSHNMMEASLGIVPFALGVLAGKAAVAAAVGAASVAGASAASKIMGSDYTILFHAHPKAIKC